MTNQTLVVGLGLPISADGRKVLLSQRSAPGNSHWHNKWQIAGGKVEFGETVEQGIIRELKEELHVDATIRYPHPIVKTSIWYAKQTDEGMDTQVVLICYLVDIGSQVPDLAQDYDKETENWGWFTQAEAAKLDFLPLTLDIINEAFALVAKHEII
jgi:8-oxo-dGTP diphosphatase